MPNVIIYHNPRCSKSRQTLQLLRDNNIEPTIIEYLKDILTVSEIKTLLNQLNMSPRELMRKGESVFKENNLNDSSLSDNQLIEAMATHPVLIERPIVVANGLAKVGRPPEIVLEIIV